MPFLAIIKLIPSILSAIKMIVGFLHDLEIKAIEQKKAATQDAVNKLKEAKTEKEREDATKDIASGTF